MNRFLLLTIAILSAATVFGQQDPMYTQHMWNKMAVNPAYAGSRSVTSITALYRHQWAGFDGAPRTMTASVHGHLRNPKLALGLQIISDHHGLQDQTGVYGTYAYRIPMGEGLLSFGIQAGFNHHKYSLVDAVHIDAGDPNLQSDLSLFLPNVGAGVYFNAERFYAGVSVPHLIENGLNEDAGAGEQVEGAKEHRHYMAMTGGVVDLGESLKLRPSVLVKYVPGAPVQADLSAALLMMDRLWVGATYRTKASIDAMVEFQVNRQIRVGYAYDYVLGELGTQTSGSHEVLLGIDLDFGQSRIVTPRKMTPRYF